MPYVELGYISAARTPFAPASLRSLLESARAKNARLGVTGLLLHAEGSFLQVLEGPPAVVDALYATIEADRRHHRILRIFRTENAQRNFPEWTMGFVEPNEAMRSNLRGFDTFLHAASRDVSPFALQKVRDLAAQFRMGRWRQYVDGGDRAESAASA